MISIPLSWSWSYRFVSKALIDTALAKHNAVQLHLRPFSSLPDALSTATDKQDLQFGRQRRPRDYWSDPDSKSSSLELPSGKKCFVFNAKRDPDGELEPVLCFVDNQGKRLMWMDAEELRGFEKLIPRLEEYFKLHENSENPQEGSHFTGS